MVQLDGHPHSALVGLDQGTHLLNKAAVQFGQIDLYPQPSGHFFQHVCQQLAKVKTHKRKRNLDEERHRMLSRRMERELTDAAIHALAAGCPALRAVRLGGCHSITNNRLRPLAARRRPVDYGLGARR